MRFQLSLALIGLALSLAPASAWAQGKKQPMAGDPYTLATCPISGKALGSMGDPIVKVYDGREVRLCCGGCLGTFEKDKAKHFKAIDKMMIADQKGYYPSKMCVVSKKSLMKKGKDIGIDVIVGNRLFRLCSDACKKKLIAKPKKYLARLDKATAKKQREKYPLETCLVAGGKLGSMGKPVEVVIASRLVRLCCKGCPTKLLASPPKYLPKLDAAWKASGDGKKAAGGHGKHKH
ncbi:MAG: hypothetical protein JKY65_16110 [Planctomycetes bacterium]|nr:hypothetical protein [Planctomycetota bacterium]